MSEKTDLKIMQALLDPRWNIGRANFAGAKAAMITLDHPTYGLIHSMVPISTAIELHGLLAKVISDADESQ